jgi:hypothetical protein
MAVNGMTSTYVNTCMKTLLLGIALTYAAAAQTLGEPFFLVRITQGDPSAIQPYRHGAVNVDVVGMQAITGDSQNWFIEPHASFASFEALDKALATAEFPDARRMIGVYRTGLSYRADEAIKLVRTARYFQVTVFRIRPGAEIDFSELIRIRKTAFDSINLDRPEIGYQIISGASSGTYVFLAPLQTLRTLDNTFARLPHSEAAPRRNPEARQIQWEADVTREHMLFRVEPHMSKVTEEFAAADPEFWRIR